MISVRSAALLCGGVVMLYWAVPVVYAGVSKELLRRRTQKRGVLCVTFDDGPGVTLTPAILEVLRQHGVKGSFFVLGRNVVGREHIVRRIAQEGHEVCSHGDDHVNHWRTWPLRSIADIKAGWRALDGALGVSRGRYPFRPPYGRLNLGSLLYLWWKRVPICLWTIDSGDTSARAEFPPADWCAGQVAARGGGVVLYHDFERHGNQVPKYVLGSLEAALRETSGSMVACRPMSSLWNRS